ncbi:unnamed protein product [Lathyrus oleraceus]
MLHSHVRSQIPAGQTLPLSCRRDLPGAAVHSPAPHPPGFFSFSADPCWNSATVAGKCGTDGVLDDLARRRPTNGEFINFIMISISMPVEFLCT